MLSRTADYLFWLGRYSERAGNVARGLAATTRMVMLARPLSAGDEWRALLIATGSESAFRAKHAQPTPEAVVHWLTLDLDNPSGIGACVEAARRNARAVRSALTVDMWEAINDSWIEFRRMDAGVISGDRLPGFLDWVRSRALLFNGAATDTMLRDDAWRFVHLGTMLERADNTARLLDVRHAAFAPEAAGDAANYAQWQAVLRAVSALRAYQHVYHARLQPRLVAELLLLRPELPRSLVACYSNVETVLKAIAKENGGIEGECHRLAAALQARMRSGEIGSILDAGLHDFLTQTIDHNIELGRQIGRHYLGAPQE
ncbi:alpha-E domain-containing protein [Roseomonas marmotae]|uniref:Alpha-E domain-containing protein n=1 Tax=Roseomonas marmotae TaxID=2768161 RepID=A0ABS3K8Y1_9PROT|nr:alpha-E domain-containing protein [Roseomonas marmotae]MBO1073919.1 alpha-E domain-containing protein [Roseomonas marmotae]QTI78464.1 alpha-E domain-containing protein [Roseomonas marmotae]